MKGKGKVAYWFTRNGIHIPVYESYDKKRNEPPIKTKPKTYTVYRAGDLSGGSTGLVYFAIDKDVADSYAKPSSFKMQGKIYKRPRRDVNEYEVKLKNPLVVESDDDVNCAIKAYNKLYPHRNIKNTYDEKLFEYAKQDGERITGTNSRDLYLDRANGKALKQSKYDGIVYKTYNFTTHKRQTSQIITLPTHKNIKKRNSK